MQLGFVHGPCSLLELFIKVSELWFSLLPVFVLSFPQFANEILKSTGARLWQFSQTNVPRAFTLRAFEDWEMLEVKNVPVCKACRRSGHCPGFSVSCSSLLQRSSLHPQRTKTTVLILCCALYFGIFLLCRGANCII